MATMYHPPGNDDYALRSHIFQFLDRALNRYPNSGIVLLGDFNQFNPGICAPPLKTGEPFTFLTKERRLVL